MDQDKLPIRPTPNCPKASTYRVTEPAKNLGALCAGPKTRPQASRCLAAPKPDDNVRKQGQNRVAKAEGKTEPLPELLNVKDAPSSPWRPGSHYRHPRMAGLTLKNRKRRSPRRKSAKSIPSTPVRPASSQAMTAPNPISRQERWSRFGRLSAQRSRPSGAGAVAKTDERRRAGRENERSA